MVARSEKQDSFGRFIGFEGLGIISDILIVWLGCKTIGWFFFFFNQNPGDVSLFSY